MQAMTTACIVLNKRDWLISEITKTGKDHCEGLGKMETPASRLGSQGTKKKDEVISTVEQWNRSFFSNRLVLPG